MNLHGIVSSAIGAVNPPAQVSIQVSSGYTTNLDGTQVPAYSVLNTTAQVQALTGQDLKKLDSLNVQGVTQKAYLTGDFEGVFRVLGKGGDLITIGNYTYLVSAVLERWPDWVCVALRLQVN